MPEISFSCDLDTSEQALYRLLRFFTKIRAHFTPLLLLCAKGHAQARLLGCKRPRDGSLPLPTFCGFEGSNPSDKNENISFCRLLTRRRGLRIVRDDVCFFKANAVSHSLRRSSSPRKASGFVGTPNTGYASLAATFL